MDQSASVTGPASEAERVRILREYQILDSGPEVAFDRITKLAAEIFDAPVAMVSLVDSKRQWIKSAVGTDLHETPREVAFCSHVADSGEALIVPNAMQDPRFSANPLVVASPKIRFYAGAPLRTRSGHILGSLCIIDTKPRPPLDDRQHQQLAELADIIMGELDLRQAMRQRDEARQLLEQALEFSNIAIFEFNLSSDGVRWAGPVDEVWGDGARATVNTGEAAFGRMHPDDAPHVRALIENSIATGQPYEAEFRVTDPVQGQRWIAGRGNVTERNGENVLIGINLDISKAKQREELNALLTRELHHRMRNLFAMLRAIISLTRSRATSVDDYVERIEGRLRALDRAQHVLLNADFLSGSMHALCGEIAEIFPRIRFRGPAWDLPENALVALALVLNELATNAAKYGALSIVSGHIDVEWGLAQGEGGEPDKMILWWREYGVAKVTAPEGPTGFGWQLIDRSVRDNLHGSIEQYWQLPGFACRIDMPAFWEK
ncbi:MAG: HWE histidine kinase domain-containing protein [Parasphingorhabdus sp.]|nr:HWE histidine kinase domain-containing protein [Parasphingorhabdus sp.]